MASQIQVNPAPNGESGSVFPQGLDEFHNPSHACVDIVWNQNSEFEKTRKAAIDELLRGRCSRSSKGGKKMARYEEFST